MCRTSYSYMWIYAENMTVNIITITLIYSYESFYNLLMSVSIIWCLFNCSGIGGAH